MSSCDSLEHSQWGKKRKPRQGLGWMQNQLRVQEGLLAEFKRVTTSCSKTETDTETERSPRTRGSEQILASLWGSCQELEKEAAKQIQGITSTYSHSTGNCACSQQCRENSHSAEPCEEHGVVTSAMGSNIATDWEQLRSPPTRMQSKTQKIQTGAKELTCTSKQGSALKKYNRGQHKVIFTKFTRNTRINLKTGSVRPTVTPINQNEQKLTWERNGNYKKTGFSF